MRYLENFVSRVGASLLLVLLLTNVMTAPALYGQSTSAAISGAVTDDSGAVVPGANITATQTETGASRSAVADASGRYRLPGLPVGSYKIDASYQGFKTVTRSGITLVVGQEAVVDIALQVGAVAEIVEVTGEVPLLETTTAVLGSVVEQKQILELPLNGRSFTELATLQAGAVVSQTGGVSVSQGYGSKISISGGRFTSNLFLLDGTVMNDSYNSAGSAAGGVVSGVEAIREFKVITNAYSAEYGQHTGGVVNAISKSGTNSFHGSVYNFLRNDNLDAPRWEDNAFNKGKKPEFRRNQFGAAIGGPIKRDQTFFFANYEGLRANLGNISVVGVPDAQARAGRIGNVDFSTTPGFPVVRPLIAKLWPVPPADSRQLADGIVEFTRVEDQPFEQNYLTGRVDHKLSDNDSFFVRYTLDRGLTRPYASTNAIFEQTTRNQFTTFQYDKVISATLLNSLNLGFTRSRTGSLGLVVPGFERVSFTDSPLGHGVVTVAGGIRSTGSGSTDPRFFTLNNYQIRDDVSWSRGGHAMKAGFSLSRLAHNDVAPRQPAGQFDFPHIQALLRNEPNNALITIREDAARYIRQNILGAYFQDDMQISSTLMLNLGVRWEAFTLPRELRGKGHIALEDKFYELNPNGTNKYGLEDIKIQNSNFTSNPSLNSFSPRAGLAWTPGNGKTTFRAGAGFFFEPLVYWTYRITTLTTAPLSIEARLQDTNGNGLTGTALGGGRADIDFPNAYFTQQSSFGGTPRYESIDPTPNHPYSMKFSFDIQHQLNNSLLMRAGYSGTHGVHQGVVYENNGRRPIVQANGELFFPTAGPDQNTRFGRSRHREFYGNQFYHSMRLETEQRVTAGLQFRAAYTWAKNIDDGTSLTGSTDFDSDGAGRYYTFRERGPSALDTRHAFTFNSVYELPGQNLSGAAGKVLGSWSLSGLIRLSSGQPITPVMGFDRSRSTVGTRYPSLPNGGNNNPTSGTTAGCATDKADSPVRAGTKLGTPDLWYDPCAFVMPAAGFLGNLGRNTVTGPGIATLDLGLSKNFALPMLGEQGNLMFRGEFFNVLNRPNFDTPGVSLYAAPIAANPTANPPTPEITRVLSTAGRVTGTATSARQIQLALKVVF